MARVTVEDCLTNLENRFELVLVAAKRARQLSKGAEAHLEWDNDKPTVMALREIAEEYIDASVLNEDDVAPVEETEATATMSSDAEAEVGALAAQSESADESTEAGEESSGEVDVAAALAAALAADLGAGLGAGMANADNNAADEDANN